MQDDSVVGWDPISLPPHISPSLRLYVLFLLVAVFVTLAKLVVLWIAAPPFRLSRQTNNADYLRRLQTTRRSVQQWLLCTLLGCGFVGSIDVFEASGRLLEAKSRDMSLILFAVRNFCVGPEMASLAALFLFLTQWHLLNRIERLGK